MASFYGTQILMHNFLGQNKGVEKCCTGSSREVTVARKRAVDWKCFLKFNDFCYIGLYFTWHGSQTVCHTQHVYF